MSLLRIKRDKQEIIGIIQARESEGPTVLRKGLRITIILMELEVLGARKMKPIQAIQKKTVNYV